MSLGTMNWMKQNKRLDGVKSFGEFKGSTWKQLEICSSVESRSRDVEFVESSKS